MTDHAQDDLDALDANVRGHVERVWPEVVAWNERLTSNFLPQPGSDLAADDLQVPDMWVSHVAWLGLATGSQHLMSSIRCLTAFGPVVMSLQSMLRTAIWGGAQAVWLLAPDESDERIRRALRVHFYSKDNYRKWLNTFDEANPSTWDPSGLQRAKTSVSEHLKAIGKQAKVDQTRVVKDVAALVYAGQPDAVVDCERGWRSLGAIAHALPWELQTRATSETIASEAGHATSRVTARWAELGSDLGFAHEFLQRGWALLDERSDAHQSGDA
ncbi:hypothetical protein [Nocardioides sp. InS609-2]|uniref:hypothetical protein n=1 Tax=Nocardioides sp. InS609-2 TaxID=2760705 RepID=UPI0020BD7ED2|nr:hypothetical protein [Nocardioides sp. InS609-2]